MASQLSLRDKRLLNAYQQKKIGFEPYEDGVWGTQGARDFAYFELYDENNSLIQFKNLPLSNFTVNEVNNNIQFYPGNHIRGLGYESGKFVVKYTFLRKMAGDESSVLVHTSDKVNTKAGDVYTNMQQIYLRDDGIIFAATEEEYINSPNIAEQLGIEDLKYQINAISSDRTEVRLKAKKINGSYMDQFIDMQTSIKDINIDNQAFEFRATTTAAVDSLELELTEGDFSFIEQMKLGTIIIPECYTVNQISVPVKTGINILKNPHGEEMSYDNQSNVIKLGDVHQWDSTLHSEAIKVQHWTDGFSTHAGTAWDGLAHIGYHAHWIQNEGVNGGVCMKFPDMNELFAVSQVGGWDPEFPSRGLTIKQEMPNLQGQGIKNHDIVNISLDVRSTEANKGVQLSLYYPWELTQEDEPPGPGFGVLAGYHNPENTAPTEPQPQNPPEAYLANTVANALAVEPKPSSDPSVLIANSDQIHSNLILTWEIGQTTAELFHPHGAGAWRLTVLETEVVQTYLDEHWGQSAVTIPTYLEWAPSIGNDANGTLSQGDPGGQWVWNGSIWTPSGQYAGFPVAPAGTVSNELSVNYHPYANFNDDTQAKTYYRRDTAQGENAGWQTGTAFGTSATGWVGDRVLLFKDDLVWETKWNYSANNDELSVKTIEDWSESNIFRERKVVGEDDAIERDLYDDIFERGRIVSVTRAKEINADNKVRDRHYVIFYDDGRAHDRSNKVFQMKIGETFFYEDQTTATGVTVRYLKDINEAFNEQVMQSGGNFEVTFNRWVGWLYVFAVGGQVWALESDGRIINWEFIVDETYPDNLTDKFSITQTPDVWFPGYFKANHWSRYTALIGETLYKHKTDPLEGFDQTYEINTSLRNCGIMMDVGSGHQEVTFGVRNPGASNYGIHDAEGNVIDAGTTPLYDNGTGITDYDMNPTKIGVLSPKGLWEWDGNTWISNVLSPPVYSYHAPPEVRALAQPTIAGVWETINVQIPIPHDWQLDQKWWLRVDGHWVGGSNQGVVHVDNMYMDFTLKDQSQTIPVKRPYTAQIMDVRPDGLSITVDKSFAQRAEEIGVEDEDSSNTIFDISTPPAFNKFGVTYMVNNPKDFRTYLKFDDKLFLTTNFKQDRINVGQFPYSVVYKLYEPLPTTIVEFDECTIVKEMTNPLIEKVQIIDFIPEEEPDLVLRSPDLDNVESPVQRRTTQYKTETDILTDDDAISSELRNEYLSQSLDSVELNTDYSRYENFINFSSAETRIRNFKKKLQNIEEHKISSASYIGVSGSLPDLNTYHFKIEDVKNNLDPFEKYMYYESSSYSSGSLGIFYDNAWPKTGGDGKFGNKYVLAHTTSSQTNTWFNNAMASASNYDLDNTSKLTNVMPEFIVEDNNNAEYVRFTDMIGQHFDYIWEYINSMTDSFDRRDKLDEGISKDLLWSVAKSLGWKLHDGKDLVDLPRYSIGKEVTGSVYSDYSSVSERDVSREIWSRIINNMPFFLKNKGTVKALKGLINIYGIPSTILRVKEYGGPNVPDNETPQFEITRKFTKALDFRGGQSVKVAWDNDTASGRKPDTVEFRFRAATGSNQILVEKKDDNNRDWFIRLKDNGSSDNYGNVSLMLSGSQVGVDVGQYKEISSSSLPVYDGDFYSVMVARTSGSSNTAISQSYQLSVGKYDSSRSKIHLYSTSTMDVTLAASSSFSNAWTGNGDVHIGGRATVANVGVRFSGSIMEYRHWTETLNTASFKNHIANPKAYDGNSVSSSYENLVLRYSMNDNKDLTSDTAGIRDVSSNQTSTLSGSHSGFTGNFFRSVVDEQKTHIPSIGALRRSTNKIRIEENQIKSGFNLSSERRATVSAYDTAPNDSNKVGIWFSPTDVINNDIINSVGDLNFDNYLGDPRDRLKLSYNGLNYVADNYWKKYTSPNNFWDYIRLIKYYDQSLFPQLRKLIPARAKPDIGVMIEPNIFERPKVILGRTPNYENTYYSSSIDISKAVDGLIVTTGSYNHDRSSITDYEAYTGKIGVYSYQEEISGSSVISASAENLLKEASASLRDSFMDRSIWQRLNTDDEYYSNVTMSFGSGQGDTINGVKQAIMPVISGSRIYGVNQETIGYYSSSLSASLDKAYSSSFKDTDLDNYSHLFQGLRNSFYEGVKNTGKTTSDGAPPIEVIISAPTKLVTTDEGESNLTTGDGMVPDFKEPVDKEFSKLPVEDQHKGGLKNLFPKVESDEDRAREKTLKMSQQKSKQEKQLKSLKESTKHVQKNNSNKNK